MYCPFACAGADTTKSTALEIVQKCGTYDSLQYMVLGRDNERDVMENICYAMFQHIIWVYLSTYKKFIVMPMTASCIFYFLSLDYIKRPHWVVDLYFLGFYKYNLYCLHNGKILK